MVDAALISALKVNGYLQITVTNNDSTDYTNAPVDVPINPSDLDALLSLIKCDITQMKLVDDQGNAVQFWVEGWDAYKAGTLGHPNVHLWFRTDLSASSTKTLTLTCDPNNPTYVQPTYSNPVIFDKYYDHSSTSEFYTTTTYAVVDSNFYYDPPASIHLEASQQANADQDVWADVGYSDKMIIITHYALQGASAGHFIAGSDGSKFAGPYVWYGSTSPWAGTGTNYGYYDTTYHILGTYPTDGKWHRVWIKADVPNSTYDLCLDTTCNTNLSFVQNLGTWTSTGTNYVREIAYNPGSLTSTGDPWFDSLIIVYWPYTNDPTVSYNKVVTLDTSCLTRSLETL